MFKFLKKTNGLAIFSFIFAVVFFLFHLLAVSDIFDIGEYYPSASIIIALFPIPASILGIIARVSIHLKHIGKGFKEYSRYEGIGIIFSYLGILTGFYFLILLGSRP